MKNSDEIKLLSKQLHAIEQSASAHPWTNQMFVDSLLAGHQYLLAKSNAQIVGYLLFSKVMDEIEILAIAVHPGCQRQGFGQMLLNELFCVAKKNNVHKIYLEVRRSNKQAIRFYQRMKFRQIGVRQGYYRADNGRREDAFLFWRLINTKHEIMLIC